MTGYRTELAEINELHSTGLLSHTVKLSDIFTKAGHLTLS
jgi:hypothetical protein